MAKSAKHSGEGTCGREGTSQTGNVTDEIIAEYIEKQSLKAPEEQDQDFSVEEL
jgi:hypothetical protein